MLTKHIMCFCVLATCVCVVKISTTITTFKFEVHMPLLRLPKNKAKILISRNLFT